MALRYRTRRVLSLLVLLVGLPIYIVLATTVISQIARPNLWIELAIYVGLGVLWALPMRAVFRGVGREDPEKAPVPKSVPGPVPGTEIPQDRPDR